jgi:hypothetical protein
MGRKEGVVGHYICVCPPEMLTADLERNGWRVPSQLGTTNSIVSSETKTNVE